MFCCLWFFHKIVELITTNRELFIFFTIDVDGCTNCFCINSEHKIYFFCICVYRDTPLSCSKCNSFVFRFSLPCKSSLIWRVCWFRTIVCSSEVTKIRLWSLRIHATSVVMDHSCRIIAQEILHYLLCFFICSLTKVGIAHISFTVDNIFCWPVEVVIISPC